MKVSVLQTRDAEAQARIVAAVRTLGNKFGLSAESLAAIENNERDPGIQILFQREAIASILEGIKDGVRGVDLDGKAKDTAKALKEENETLKADFAAQKKVLDSTVKQNDALNEKVETLTNQLADARLPVLTPPANPPAVVPEPNAPKP